MRPNADVAQEKRLSVRFEEGRLHWLEERKQFILETARRLGRPIWAGDVALNVADQALYRPALAEKERRLISERTRAALQAKKAAGARLGNLTNLVKAGLAGRVVQAQAADEFASSVLPALASVRRAGASTLAEIAEALNDRGVRSVSGGKWHRSAVRNLLARAQSCEA